MEVQQRILLERPPEHPVEAHKSWIEAVSPEILELAPPICRRTFVFLPVGARVLITIPSRQAVQRFVTEIVGRQLQPVPCLQVRAPQTEQVERIQRRRHFREAVCRPVRCQWSSRPTDQFLATTRDLSASGLLMRAEPDQCPSGLDSGDLLHLELELPQSTLNLASRIICVRLENHQALHLAVEYRDIREQDQNQIVQFLFAVQRNLLRQEIKRS
jgi:c-di-GMP-binding flagellar brake protein YcgR